MNINLLAAGLDENLAQIAHRNEEKINARDMVKNRAKRCA